MPEAVPETSTAPPAGLPRENSAKTEQGEADVSGISAEEEADPLYSVTEENENPDFLMEGRPEVWQNSLFLNPLLSRKRSLSLLLSLLLPLPLVTGRKFC